MPHARNIAVVSSENPDRPPARALLVLCRRTGDFNAHERKRALTTPIKSDFLFHQFLSIPSLGSVARRQVRVDNLSTRIN
jgi:hypothetical protein